MNIREAVDNLEFKKLVRRPETRLGAALLTILAGTIVFFQLADEVGEGDTHAFDRAILNLFRVDAHPADVIGPSWVGEVAHDLTSLGSYGVIILFVLIVLGYLLLNRDYLHAIEVTVASGGGAVVGSLLKNVYLRPRPEVVPRLVKVSTWSFPSGHSTISAVVYLTLGILLARYAARRRQALYIIGVACLMALVVGSTRVILGVHYPTDVLAGWAVGLTWSLFSWLVVNFWENWKLRHELLQRTSNSDDTPERSDT